MSFGVEDQLLVKCLFSEIKETENVNSMVENGDDLHWEMFVRKSIVTTYLVQRLHDVEMFFFNEAIIHYFDVRQCDNPVSLLSSAEVNGDKANVLGDKCRLES